MEFKDANGNIKTWVWAVAGLAIFGVVFLLMRGGGSSSSGGSSVNGQNDALTSELQNLEAAILALQKGTGNVPKPKPTPHNPTNPGPHDSIRNIFSGIKLYDKTGKLLGTLQHNQRVEVTQVRRGDQIWYRILSGPRTGEWFKGNHLKHNPR